MPPARSFAPLTDKSIKSLKSHGSPDRPNLQTSADLPARVRSTAVDRSSKSRQRKSDGPQALCPLSEVASKRPFAQSRYWTEAADRDAAVSRTCAVPCLRSPAPRFRASPARPGPRRSGAPGTARRPRAVRRHPDRARPERRPDATRRRAWRRAPAPRSVMPRSSPSSSRICCICAVSASALERTRRWPLARRFTGAVAGLAVRRTEARLDGAFACRLAREGGVSASAPSGFPGGRPRRALKLGPAALPGGRPRRAPALLLVSREAGSGGLRAMVRG